MSFFVSKKKFLFKLFFRNKNDLQTGNADRVQGARRCETQNQTMWHPRPVWVTLKPTQILTLAHTLTHTHKYRTWRAIALIIASVISIVTALVAIRQGLFLPPPQTISRVTPSGLPSLCVRLSLSPTRLIPLFLSPSFTPFITCSLSPLLPFPPSSLSFSRPPFFNRKCARTNLLQLHPRPSSPSPLPLIVC